MRERTPNPRREEGSMSEDSCKDQLDAVREELAVEKRLGRTLDVLLRGAQDRVRDLEKEVDRLKEVINDLLEKNLDLVEENQLLEKGPREGWATSRNPYYQPGLHDPPSIREGSY